MTQRDMAGILNIDVKTLRNWRKDKPSLYTIVLKGFAYDEAVKTAKENYERLEAVASKTTKKNSELSFLNLSSGYIALDNTYGPE